MHNRPVLLAGDSQLLKTLRNPLKLIYSGSGGRHPKGLVLKPSLHFFSQIIKLSLPLCQHSSDLSINNRASDNRRDERFVRYKSDRISIDNVTAKYYAVKN